MYIFLLTLLLLLLLLLWNFLVYDVIFKYSVSKKKQTDKVQNISSSTNSKKYFVFDSSGGKS